MAQGPSTALEHHRRRWNTRRTLFAIVVLALLAVFVPPLIAVNRFRARIAGSMEQALGRHVTVGGVTLRLVPRPGFDLKNVAISDDPAFGAEPMLRADQVTADLRLSSLWRGRMEIARLSLKSGADIAPPSLNLVRAADGRWNIEALLQRTSQTPSAPTAQPHAEARLRFPYIEADGGRINLKLGQEKKVYALTEADFALWLASENEWAFRLAARPVRTDFNLSDTGVLKINGRFRRAANLRDTPLELTAVLQDAQLGQLTNLIYGRDRGWRGGVELALDVKGTPAALKLTSHSAIREFRRYDINTTEALRLDARCTAAYSTTTQQLSDVNCQMPVGNGTVTARGSIEGLIQPRAYDVSFAAENVGVQAMVSLARHMKKDLAADLSAEGTVDGAITVRKTADEAASIWAGDAKTSEIVLRSAMLSPELTLPTLTLTVAGPGSEHWTNKPVQAARNHRQPAVIPPRQPEILRLAATAFHLPLGAASPADVTAWFGGEHYEIDVQGDARVPRVLQLARALGLRVPQYNVDGAAKLDVRVAGAWSGFQTPLATGTAQLHNVSTRVGGVNLPVQISSANLQLAPDTAMLQNAAVRFSGSPVQLDGWVRITRNCETLEQCPIQFDARADELPLDALNRLLNPSLATRPWYDVFGGRPQSVLTRVQATGHISIAKLMVRSLLTNHFTANAQLEGGKLVLKDVRADLLGGSHRGEWRADFTGAQPVYTASGAFTEVAMAQLASLMHDNWAGGAIDATCKLSMSGWSAADFASSVTATANFDWHNGVLHHVALDDQSGPLQFKRFAGQLELRDGTVTVAESKMATPAGIYLVSGTASLERELGLKLRNSGHAYSVSGPLNRPKVTTVASEQQAALKP